MSRDDRTARRVELRDLGFVRDSGRRRLTHWGGEAAAWVAAADVADGARIAGEGVA